MIVIDFLMHNPGLTREKLEKTVKAMNNAFPDAIVKSYKGLINSLELPDPDDRHVIAAAIKSTSNIIVTFNQKDFPSKKIEDDHKITVLHPDEFIINLSEIDENLIKQAFENQLLSLRNPSIPKESLLEILRRGGLNKSLKIFE